MTRRKEPPLVRVEWIDSSSPARKWQDRNDMKGYTCLSCSSVGWLMEKRKDAILIASTLGDPCRSTEVGDWTAIPRGCVKHIRRLK